MGLRINAVVDVNWAVFLSGMENGCASQTLFEGNVSSCCVEHRARGTSPGAWTPNRTLLETFRQDKMAPCPRVGAEEVKRDGHWLLTEAAGELTRFPDGLGI